MNTKPVAIVGIVAQNRMIGNVDDKPLPFNLPTGLGWIFHVSGAMEDPEVEEKVTHSYVYGRRVYEEFMGYGILPAGKGVNIVISSTLANPDGTPKPLPTVKDDPSSVNPRMVAVGSVEQALELGTKLETENPRPGDLCIVLGGQRIYADTLPSATFLRICNMHQDFEGGILFPEYDVNDWKPIFKSEPKMEKNEVDGKDVEIQAIDSVRAKDADDVALAPVIESMKRINKAFPGFSPISKDE